MRDNIYIYINPKYNSTRSVFVEVEQTLHRKIKKAFKEFEFSKTKL